MEISPKSKEQIKIEFNIDTQRVESLIRDSQPEMSPSFNECHTEQYLQIKYHIRHGMEYYMLQYFVTANRKGIETLYKDLEELKIYLEKYFAFYQNDPNYNYDSDNFLLLIKLPNKLNFIHDVLNQYMKNNASWNKNYQLTNHELAKLALEFYSEVKDIVEKIEAATEYFDELNKSAKQLAETFYKSHPNAHRNYGLDKLVKEFFYKEWGMTTTTDNILTLSAPKYEQDCFTNLNIRNSEVYYYSDKGLEEISSRRLSRFLEFGAVSSLTALAGYKAWELSDIWTDQASICLIAFCVVTIAGKELFRGNEVYFELRKRFVKNVGMLHLLLARNKKMESHPAYKIIQSISPAKPKV